MWKQEEHVPWPSCLVLYPGSVKSVKMRTEQPENEYMNYEKHAWKWTEQPQAEKPIGLMQ